MNENDKKRNLTRSRDDRFIGGVAAGIARHLNIDPAIVRIAFVISIIFGGIGVLAYLILLASVPIEGDPDEPAPRLDGSKRLWAIGGTVAVGILALVSIGITGDGFGGWMFGFAQGFWVGALIWALVITAVIWLLREAKDDEAAGDEALAADLPAAGRPAAASTVTTTLAPSPTQNAPASPATPGSREEEATTVTPEDPAAAVAPAAGGTTAGEAPTTAAPRTAETEVRPAPVRTSDVPSTFGKVMTILAIIAAAAVSAIVLMVISAGFTAVFGAIPMAAVVILLGTGLVAAALNDRHQLALWTLGAAVAIAIPMAVVSIADLRIDGTYGEVREEPSLAGSIPDDGYQLAAGAMTIDLRDYPFRDGETVDLRTRSGMGATRIVVPDDVCVKGSLEVQAGFAEVRGLESSGAGFDRSFAPGTGRGPGLDLDSEVKLGLFLVIDDSTWRESGADGSDNWDGTIDRPRPQEAARDRALKACGEATRNPATPSPSPNETAPPGSAGGKSAA